MYYPPAHERHRGSIPFLQEERRVERPGGSGGMAEQEFSAPAGSMVGSSGSASQRQRRILCDGCGGRANKTGACKAKVEIGHFWPSAGVGRSKRPPRLGNGPHSPKQGFDWRLVVLAGCLSSAWSGQASFSLSTLHLCAGRVAVSPAHHPPHNPSCWVVGGLSMRPPGSMVGRSWAVSRARWDVCGLSRWELHHLDSSRHRPA